MSQEKYGMDSRSQLLSVHDLSVSFAGKPVVQDVSFELAAGEKLALVGESGSGKSVMALSLLRLVGDAQLGGRALLDGRDLLGLSEREMQGIRGGDIAMIFQEPMTALNPLMTVGAQVAEVLQLKQSLSGAQALKQAVE
ncbi:MAG: ATP-binding cassette domain-containing protein, partial [Comamonas sp.]|nr:ATP-binding cassette domain-containing protein [Comamonas sp.]